MVGQQLLPIIMPLTLSCHVVIYILVEKQELRVVMDNALTFDKSYLHSWMDCLSTCRLWSAMILRSYERIKYEDIPDHGG